MKIIICIVAISFYYSNTDWNIFEFEN